MRETSAIDPRHARAMSLLEAYGALPESPERMARVRRELLRVPMTRQAPAWFLRPAVALSLLLGLGTVAGATVGRAPLSRVIARITGRAEVLAPAPVVVAPVKRAHHAASPAPVVAAPAPAPVVEAPVPVVTPPVAPAAPRVAHRTAEAAPIPTKEETDLLYAAKGNVDKDPAQAAALAERYLRRYPQGGFVEDALQIAIDALRQTDPSRAALLAGTYLRKFPNGDYAAVARAIRNAAR